MRAKERLCAVAAAVVLLWAPPAGAQEGSWQSPEFVRGNATFRYQWDAFQDAVLVRRGVAPGGVLVMIRHGKLEQKAGGQFLELRHVAGLWTAEVERSGAVRGLHFELDVTSAVIEAQKDLVPVRRLGLQDRSLAACTEASGRIHALVALMVSGPARNEWRVWHGRGTPAGKWEWRLSGPTGAPLPFLDCRVTGTNLWFTYLAAIPTEADRDQPVRFRTIAPDVPFDGRAWRWFEAPAAASVRAEVIGAFATDNMPAVVARSYSYADLRLYTWRNGWQQEGEPFLPRGGGLPSNPTLWALAGASALSGTIHVVGTYSFSEDHRDVHSVIHLRRDGGGAAWQTAILPSPTLGRLSLVADGGGNLLLAGVTDGGEVWLATGPSPWRAVGIVLSARAGP